MLYSDGQEIRVGDVVRIDVSHSGTVVACIDDEKYGLPHTKEQWQYLGRGILVDTSFGGLVHYPDQQSLDSESMTLVRRQNNC